MNPIVTQLLRYPVKSMGGHPMPAVSLTAKGIPGDRAWALKDEERGGIKGGKRFPQLLDMQALFAQEPTAETVSPEVSITLPGGDVVSTSDPQINSILSDAVNSPVSIWPLLPEDQLDHYRRPALAPPPSGSGGPQVGRLPVYCIQRHLSGHLRGGVPGPRAGGHT